MTGVTDGEVDRLIGLLEQDALIVPDQSDTRDAVPDDPKDEMVMACARVLGTAARMNRSPRWRAARGCGKMGSTPSFTE
jgi:hypothetical protein